MPSPNVGAIVLLTSLLILLDTPPPIDGYSIRVCQNKHCCKRTRADILQTMSNLVVVADGVGPRRISVTSSGCLSNCDIGPNVQLEFKDGSSLVLNGMVDAQTCAIQLGDVMDSLKCDGDQEEARDDGDASLSPPAKVLVAATKVMEQSQYQLADPKERIRYLTSVVDKLEGPLSSFRESAANAHAHALRAEQHLEIRDYKTAIREAQIVVEGPLAGVATSNSLFLAYRTWADAERFLAEDSASFARSARSKMDYSRVVAVLHQWRQQQPMYQTKLQREIEDLMA